MSVGSLAEDHSVSQPGFSGASAGSPRPGGRSIRLFLADGTPQGLIVAEIGNWTGKAVCAPRSRLPDLLKRPEAARTGIYVLMGPDPDRAGGAMAYIGEGDNVGARIRIHLRSEDKDFFDRLVIIVSTDENLTKSHVRYLESQVIKLTQQAGSVALTNDTHPDFQRLPEADRADMDYFVDQLGHVLPILGFDLFRRASAQSASTVASPDNPLFVFTTAGASATARETDEGFVVLAGSMARKRQSETFPAGYRALRDKLVADGQLVDGPSAELLTFATDVVFTSPSAAASIVAARSASGPLEWKIGETATTYRDWRAARLANSA
ncbi:MAG: GIY-YIG nuclease family protein [Devosia nanyangense]|uniref:GIY-YIG nuclease family protein n=1 Tax=Devosia nanyangense TaxID=1228055 RepID=A0A933L6Q4_9HYPH|nr:GIY-YIG nuclease family protein [Devosia nanyangense]